MKKWLPLVFLGLVATALVVTSSVRRPDILYAATPTIFTTAGVEVPYLVPAGTTRVLVDARGAAGAASVCSQPGGLGQQVVTILNVTGLTQLFVNVGGPGAGTVGGSNGGGNGGTGPSAAVAGGGGGGASDVRTAAGDINTRVVVAGGGGGAGGCGNQPGSTGGAGGDMIASNGNGALGTGAGPGAGGGGATTAAAGFGGAAGGLAGDTGGLGRGGNGGNTILSTTTGGAGGGGGGGVHGGGGGGGGASGPFPPGAGGGGGAGSSVASATLGSSTVISPHPVRTGAGAGVASVTITPIDPLTVVKSFNPASIQVNGASTVGIVVTNGNPFPLTGIALTDNLPAGVTINGALTTFGGNPLCTGASVTPPGTIRITGGTLAANSTCAIGVPVTSTAAGTYVNLSFAVTTTEGVSTNSNAATLVVSNVPVPPASPTPIPTATPVVVNPPVIPQVFQHVPLGIFTNPRPNTPTPVVRAVAVAPVSGPGAIAPVLRPPSTGDAGLQDEGHSIWYYVPFIAIATVFAGSAGAVWRWQRR